MKNSRKQTIAQIAMVDKRLQCQKIKVMEQKDYFAKSEINKPFMVALTLVIPAFFLAWHAEKKQWGSRLTQEILEIGTLAFVGYYKRQLVNLLKEFS